MNASIAFVEVQEAWEKDYLKKAFDLKAVYFPGTAASAQDSLKDCEILSVFIKSNLDESFFKKFPNLKFITTRSTGFDHISLEAAKKRGIVVSNVPIYGENTVAEHTFALILSLSRNLRRAYFKTRDHDFSLEGLMGFDLKDKTLGVVGTGHIGLHVIRMAQGFGMKVLAYDVKEQKTLSQSMGFNYVSFEELISRSDIISLHLPYMPSTHHMINLKNISKIKRGAVLINTARGPLVETEALVKALDDGILSGAGLDVLEGEESVLEERRFLAASGNKEALEKIQIALKNNFLLNRANVVYTPHMAFYSKEAVQRILDTTIKNIQAFIEGRPENIIV